MQHMPELYCKRCKRKIRKYVVNWYHVNDNGYPYMFLRDKDCEGVLV